MLDLSLAKEQEGLCECILAFVDEHILPIACDNHINRPRYLLVFVKTDPETSHEGLNTFILEEGIEYLETKET